MIARRSQRWPAIRWRRSTGGGMESVNPGLTSGLPRVVEGLSGGGEASVPRPKEAVANFYAGARTTLWRRKLRCEI
jgi:hypothetical protein